MCITTLYAPQVAGNNLNINQRKKAVAVAKNAFYLQGIMKKNLQERLVRCGGGEAKLSPFV